MKTTQAKKFLAGALTSAVALTAVLGAGAMPSQAKGAHHSAGASKPVKITAARAEAVTLKKFPGKIMAKTKLENEEGKWQYSVMVKSGKTFREVMVGAYSGKIEDVEVTTAAKEGIEKD